MDLTRAYRDAEERLRSGEQPQPQTDAPSYESLARKLQQYERLYGPEALALAAQDVQALTSALRAKETALKESEMLRSVDMDVRHLSSLLSCC